MSVAAFGTRPSIACPRSLEEAGCCRLGLGGIGSFAASSCIKPLLVNAADPARPLGTLLAAARIPAK